MIIANLQCCWCCIIRTYVEALLSVHLYIDRYFSFSCFIYKFDTLLTQTLHLWPCGKEQQRHVIAWWTDSVVWICNGTIVMNWKWNIRVRKWNIRVQFRCYNSSLAQYWSSHTVKRHIYAQVLFMQIMRDHIWSDKFVSHNIILFSHNNYARRHGYIVSLSRAPDFTLFNASSIHGDGSASLFPSHGVLTYSQRNSTRRYRDTVGKCHCPTRGASRTAEKV